jgi:poly-beta-1,6-N-acetyl-D-glucosamine synthase
MSLFFIISFVVFTLAAIGLLFYYLYYFLAFNKYSDDTTAVHYPPVSLVICARNNQDDLEKFLPQLLTLDYPNEYEVIVMNDCSWDNTKDLLEQLSAQYPRLKAHNLVEENLYQHDKKFPLTLGIKAALNETIVFTDADCYVKSSFWLQEIINGYSNPATDLVIGYGAYEKTKGLVNKLIRFDAANIALLYFSSTLKGHTYMGTGRNMSYRKSLFFKHKGFATHNHIRSGDDDLFINRVATNENVSIRTNKESHTLSVPKKTWGTFFNQKRRHTSTATYYKKRDKAYLAMYYVLQFLFYASFVTTLIAQSNLFYFPLGVLVIKTITHAIIYKNTLSKLDEKDLIALIPLFEIMLLVFYAGVHVANLFSKEPRWK